MEKSQMVRNNSETLSEQPSLKSLIIARGGGVGLIIHGIGSELKFA